MLPHSPPGFRTPGNDMQLGAQRVSQWGCARRPCTQWPTPVGLAAWMLDHGDGWGQSAAPVTSAVLGYTSGGHPAGDLTRERCSGQHHVVLADEHGGLLGPPVLGKQAQPVQRRQCLRPRRRERLPRRELPGPAQLGRRAYHNLIYYNQPAQDGHFAAWEQAQIFAAEVRAGLKPLRK